MSLRLWEAKAEYTHVPWSAGGVHPYPAPCDALKLFNAASITSGEGSMVGQREVKPESKARKSRLDSARSVCVTVLTSVSSIPSSISVSGARWMTKRGMMSAGIGR
eukprot:3941033-Rhodomonas_salina.2